MRARRFGLFVGISVCLMVGVAGSPARASSQAGALTCGQVITKSVVLTTSLVCRTSPNGAALNVATDGVTVDLNGHMISGGDTIAPFYGIYVTGTNVTIKNGVVKDFSAGVANLCADVTLAKVTLTGNHTGAQGYYIACGGGFTIRESTISFNDAGIQVPGLGLDLRNSLITDNRGDGVRIIETGCHCDHNTILRNGGNGIFAYASGGVFTNNVMGRNGLNGFLSEPELSEGRDGPFWFGGNMANENGGSGILIIEPQHGVTDLGGNSAHGNAEYQCFNLFCKSS